MSFQTPDALLQDISVESLSFAMKVTMGRRSW